MTDEEVFCVCYPTDEEPAFRRSDDRICYPGGTDCEVGPRNEGFNPGFLRFVYKLKEIKKQPMKSRASLFTRPSCAGSWRRGDDKDSQECGCFMAEKQAGAVIGHGNN